MLTLKKTLTYVIYIFLFLASLIPIIIYYKTFHSFGISENNQDWANAGSFFGGMYSAIFSFASVVILSVTLVLTKKYNNQQLELLMTSQRKEIFCSLFDKLTKKMDEINYAEMGLSTENDFFENCEEELFKDWESIKKNNDETFDAGTLIELSTNLCDGQWFTLHKPYYDVVLITAELLKILNKSPEEDKNFFLAYMEANASTRRLYWLFCYMYNFSSEFEDILIRNLRALRIPKGYL